MVSLSSEEVKKLSMAAGAKIPSGSTRPLERKQSRHAEYPVGATSLVGCQQGGGSHLWMARGRPVKFEPKIETEVDTVSLFFVV